MMQPVIHIANYLLHAPVLLVFALCYCDEPIRYFIMQRHMYSGKWIKPGIFSRTGNRGVMAERTQRMFHRIPLTVLLC